MLVTLGPFLNLESDYAFAQTYQYLYAHHVYIHKQNPNYSRS